MVGSGKVIAQGFGAVAAQEDGAGVFDLVQIVKGLVHADLQVLRGDLVGDLHGGVQVVSHDDLAIGVDGGAGDFLPAELGQLLLDGGLNGPGQRLAVGDEDGGGVLVVLGLAEQVGGDDAGVTLAVGDDQDLAGTGHHVDADLAEDLLLGLGHELIAGADDLIHAGHTLGAVSQGGYGLCPAHAEDAVDAADAGGG